MLTTVAIRTMRDRAGRRLRGDAVERRRMPLLADDAVPPAASTRAQDRADVVRILDAVEHDEQRRLRRRRRRPAPARCSRAAPRLRRRSPGARRRAQRDRAPAHPHARSARPLACASASASSMRLSAARADPKPPHPSGAQRLEDRIEAVDDHRSTRFASRAQDRPARARAKAAARSRAAAMRRCPRRRRQPAPRSIAGTARSSSGPPLSPVSATRIGWNSALPF